jgi:hypothetical protein
VTTSTGSQQWIIAVKQGCSTHNVMDPEMTYTKEQNVVCGCKESWCPAKYNIMGHPDDSRTTCYEAKQILGVYSQECRSDVSSSSCTENQQNQACFDCDSPLAAETHKPNGMRQPNGQGPAACKPAGFPIWAQVQF